MYSSSSSFDPFQYSTISTSLTDTPSPNPMPFLHFPAPFLHVDGELLLSEPLIQPHHNLQLNQQQQLLGASNCTLVAQASPEMNPAASKKATNRKKTKTNDSKQPTPRKRSGKKDRHSKIFTAHGPRDRRMRLSLQIARKFFDLQDMLGFDKASKTIDWLFTKSKSAIKELTDTFPKLKRSESGGEKSVSYSSESEVMSGIKLTTERRGIGAEGDSFPKQKRSRKSDEKPVFSSQAKESRDKARARARERTKEKLMIKGLEKSKPANPSNLEQLCPVENGKGLGHENQEMKSSPVKMVEEKAAGGGICMVPHQMDSSVSIMDKYLGLTAATKSTSIFDLSHQNIAVSSGADFEDGISGFQGNCNNRYSAIPDIKLSTTGNVHIENPNSIFMINPTSIEHKTTIPNFIYQDQNQNLTSLLMASLHPQDQNSSLLFMNLSNSNHQNSNPLSPMSTALHSHFTENNFSCDPNLPIKYHDSLY